MFFSSFPRPFLHALCRAVFGATVLPCLLSAQEPEVRIYENKDRKKQTDHIIAQAKELIAAGGLVDLKSADKQLKRPSTPAAGLPAANTERKSPRDIYLMAKKAYLRVGWVYLCKKCDHWHLNLAGGYLISAEGLVATCEHVAKPDAGNMREAYLIAVTDADVVLPVNEILAANAAKDAAVLKLGKHDGLAKLSPLPLQPHAAPGDPVYCFSDPMGHRGYFSAGMVNRFFSDREENEAGKPTEVVRLNVSTDWAPGSSGSAILDEFGNAIAHVTQISTLGKPNGDAPGRSGGAHTMIVLHEGVRAADVNALFKKPPTPTENSGTATVPPPPAAAPESQSAPAPSPGEQKQ